MSYELKMVCDECGDSSAATLKTGEELLDFCQEIFERVQAMNQAGGECSGPMRVLCPLCTSIVEQRKGSTRVQGEADGSMIATVVRNDRPQKQ